MKSNILQNSKRRLNLNYYLPQEYIGCENIHEIIRREMQSKIEILPKLAKNSLAGIDKLEKEFILPFQNQSFR